MGFRHIHTRTGIVANERLVEGFALGLPEHQRVIKEAESTNEPLDRINRRRRLLDVPGGKPKSRDSDGLGGTQKERGPEDFAMVSRRVTFLVMLEFEVRLRALLRYDKQTSLMSLARLPRRSSREA